MVDIAQPPLRYRARANHLTTRALSIAAACAVDAGLLWLLYLRAKHNPPFADPQMFWVRIVAGLGAYAVLQHWTLANQTGRGDTALAALDKGAALSPLLLVAALEAYWIGVGTFAELSWRHHAVGLLWTAFALMDYFATDATNQRLRAQGFAADAPGR
jgi:hypothetical protein